MYENKLPIIGKVYGVIKANAKEEYKKGQEVDMIFQIENIFEMDADAPIHERSKAIDRAKELYELYLATDLKMEDDHTDCKYCVLDIDMQEITDSPGAGRRVRGYIHKVHRF